MNVLFVYEQYIQYYYLIKSIYQHHDVFFKDTQWDSQLVFWSLTFSLWSSQLSVYILCCPLHIYHTYQTGAGSRWCRHSPSSHISPSHTPSCCEGDTLSHRLPEHEKQHSLQHPLTLFLESHLGGAAYSPVERTPHSSPFLLLCRLTCTRLWGRLRHISAATPQKSLFLSDPFGDRCELRTVPGGNSYLQWSTIVRR